MDDMVQDFNTDSGSNGIHGGTANVGFDTADAILHSGTRASLGQRHHKLIDVEAAYKDLNEQLAKVGRKEIERRISFGRTAARNRAILRCVTEYVGSSPSELQERLIEVLTVDFMDTPITDMEIIQALR
jgi:hypothetical protein